MAVLELVDIPGEVVISNVGSDTISQEKREMLRGLAETQGAGLTIEQREQFYSLLLTHADIFASSNSDLGRTDKLSHSIHTGDATPVPRVG